MLSALRSTNEPRKNPPNFHYSGWLTGILIMVCSNPYIIRKYNPLYTLNKKWQNVAMRNPALWEQSMLLSLQNLPLYSRSVKLFPHIKYLPLGQHGTHCYPWNTLLPKNDPEPPLYVHTPRINKIVIRTGDAPFDFEKVRRFDLLVPVCIHVGRGKNSCSVKVKAGYENIFSLSKNEPNRLHACWVPENIGKYFFLKIYQISYINGRYQKHMLSLKLCPQATSMLGTTTYVVF